MKISMYSVGKTNESYVAEGVADFTGRINRYFPCTWKLLSPKPGADSIDVRKQESKLILESLEKDDYLVLLDQRGRLWSSEQVASFLDGRALNGSKHLVFLIGGAFGVDQSVRDRATQIWSLSPLVFPHQLVRLILTEQVYRACTILRNEKYHHN